MRLPSYDRGGRVRGSLTVKYFGSGGITRASLYRMYVQPHRHRYYSLCRTCPLHPNMIVYNNNGCGKREAHMNWSMVILAKVVVLQYHPLLLELS